ncbi:hypothetical protein F4821DRAFT_278674 [Hypoxylon rubiginosum]|uniref:Uncharacterized protein n=1 Tax=Hypoxylon rubiginosum TaxID=110542 RepID=A0ACC0D0J2_9PEZI|nr:hypothetical protein F4821DRAFT_278674 [Hypoxylon rubiginosum]
MIRTEMEAELAVEAKEGAEHTVEEAGSNGKPRFTTSPVSNAESSPELGRAPLILRPLDDGPNLDGDLTGPPSSYSSPSNSPVGPELHFTYIDSIGESAFLLALPTLLPRLAAEEAEEGEIQLQQRKDPGKLACRSSQSSNEKYVDDDQEKQEYDDVEGEDDENEDEEGGENNANDNEDEDEGEKNQDDDDDEDDGEIEDDVERCCVPLIVTSLGVVILIQHMANVHVSEV